MYDMALDTTGDWLFGPYRDLQGVTGPQLDVQRMMIRCKIPRGTFVYDESGTLGSELHEVLRMGAGGALPAVEAFVNDALEGMEGVVINGVDVKFGSNNRQVIVTVNYVHLPDADESALGEFPTVDELNANDTAEFALAIE